MFGKNSGDYEETEMNKETLNQDVQARELLFGLMTDPRMEVLFELFDKNGSGNLSFKEVAIGLYQLSRNIEEATKTAMNVLLIMDKDDTRTLNYEQFGRLIMAIIAATGSTFEIIYDDLAVALTSQNVISDDDLAALTVADVLYATVREERQNDLSIIDSFSYCRLKKLFDLWDVDGDGNKTISELTGGLQKFQSAASIEMNAQEQARLLIGFDEDGDHQLDPREFANAMSSYAKAFEVELHELIDYMCVTAVIGDQETNEFRNAYGKALNSNGKTASTNAVEEGYNDFYD